MSKARFLVLSVGPLIIVAASTAGAWLTAERHDPLPYNTVFFSEPSTPGDSGVFPNAGRDDRRQTPRVRSGRSTPATVNRRDSMPQVCQRLAARLDQQLNAWPDGRKPWSLLCAEPFVIAGMMNQEQLRDWYTQTIHPATLALWNQYFDARPTGPITLLLLPEEESYRDVAAWLFGDNDVSYFGYYRPEQRVVIANVETGAGALVHELTHALMDFDFPEIPDWINEGLASLFEQCRFRDHGRRLEGLVNWRLPELQDAIRAGELRSLEDLMTADDFRGPQEGLNYAQARYFCLYLQQLGLLENFYRSYRASAGRDPTGWDSLQQAFPKTPLTAIDASFRRWALNLRWSQQEEKFPKSSTFTRP